MTSTIAATDPVTEQIARLQWQIYDLLDEVWSGQTVDLRHEAHPQPVIMRDPTHPLYPPLAESLRRLQRRWPVEELGEVAAAMWHRQALWNRGYSMPGDPPWAMAQIVNSCLIAHPPAGLLERLEAHLRRLLSALDEPEPEAGVLSYLSHRNQKPDLSGCLWLLLALPETQDILTLVERVALGGFDTPLDGARHYGREVRRSYELHNELNGYAPFLLERLFRRGSLSYERFCQAVVHLPDLLEQVSSGRLPTASPFNDPEWSGEAFQAALQEHFRRLGSELARDLSEENCHLLTRVRGFHGGPSLLAAAWHHATREMGTLVVGSIRYGGTVWGNGVDAGVIHLARAVNIEPATLDERTQLVEHLRRFPETTLKALLPVAVHGRHVLCEALGWHDATPLVDEITRLAGLEGQTAVSWWGDDPLEPTGVLDVATVRAAIERIGAPAAKEILALYRRAKVGADETAMLVEAAMGWNRGRIERGIGLRSPIAVRAYGLLPLSRGEDELLDRFLFLQRFARESNWFPSAKRSRETAAVAAAMAHLAQNAGYADTVRFEWAMEARLALEVIPAGRTWDVGEYRVELTLDGARPQVAVSRGARLYKRTPAAVRRSESYPAIADSLKQLRAHASRVRGGLEALMARGDRLTRDEVAGLARLPVVATMLSALVGIDDAGLVGLIDPVSVTLQALDGTPRRIEGDLRVAHPYDLSQAGQLGAWQRAIVARRLVQPFKQVFRELYLLTPAEEAALNASQRFAGHALDPRVATRVLGNRGWRCDSSYWSSQYKVFARLGVQALFELEDAQFSPEGALVTSGRVCFLQHPTPPQISRWRPEQTVPLTQVPPLPFSEVMRDCELAVIVAQRSGEARLTNEAYQRRAELVTALVEDLALQSVSVEGHYARVQGSLARYRVHLGTGAIHVEPGNYLCIVPDGWGQGQARVYLPFAGDEDTRVSEIISKILLLANDAKIKDESILRQIRAESVA